MTDSATGNAGAEQELRDLLAERVAAVHTRDAANLAARLADDVITFDVLPPLNSRGSAAVAEHMRQWFDGYDGDIGYDVNQLRVAAENDLGFCSFVYNVNAILKTGDVIDMWVCATLCCQPHRRHVAHRPRPRVRPIRSRDRAGPDQPAASTQRQLI